MKKLTFLNHIDSLRGLAVLLVTLFHLDVNLFEGGFIGVDVFFVISGFLITRILNHEFQKTGNINFKTFYTRRVRRLMPTLFLTILLTFILTFLAFSPSDFINATNSMFMSSIALSNFHFLSISDYFNTASNFKPLLHTWSLGIEEQFYLLYPITLFFILKTFKNKGEKKVLFCLVTLFFFSLFYTFYTSIYGVSEELSSLFLPEDNYTSNISSLQFYLLPFRMFEFLAGAIIALLRIPKIKSEYTKLAFNLFGLFIIICCALLFSKNTPYLATINLLPCLGVAILIYLPPSKYLTFFSENRFLRFSGQISYTLYLLHWPIIVIYRYVFDRKFTPLEQIGLFTLIFLLSSVIYTYYETPLRYKKSKFSIKSNKSLYLILVLTISFVFFLKHKIHSENGWLFRLSDENQKLVDKIGIPKDFHKTHYGGVGYKEGWLRVEPVEPNKKGNDPDLILLGDSHAGHLLTGLDSIIVQKGKRSIYVPSLSSTLKLPDIVSTLRRPINQVTLNNRHKIEFDSIMKYPKSPVLFSHAWVSQINKCAVFNHFTNKFEKIPTDSTGWKLLAEKIVKFHNTTGTDRVFIILGENPTTSGGRLNYIEKLFRPKYLSKINPLTSEFPQNRIRFNSFFESYFSTIENIIFIDPSKAFCKIGTCIKQKNNIIYYADGGHLSKGGSLRVIEYLEKPLLKIINKKNNN
jgi:peptidoglycan/LPS O-acetylase OafA/YrhL